MNVREIIDHFGQLEDEPQYIIEEIARTLAPQSDTEQTDWQSFLAQTYGSTSEHPIQRWDQGNYELREILA